MRHLIIALALVALACTPGRIDPDQTPQRLADWFDARERFIATSGVDITKPVVAPCAPGPDCAYSVPYIAKRVIGRASWKRAEARVVEDLDDEIGAHTVLHEWGHTMGLLHVDSPTALNPIVHRGHGCISEAELTQLCALWTCRKWEPECHVEDEWRVLVPKSYLEKDAERGESYELTPGQYLGVVGTLKPLWDELRNAARKLL